jgi:thiol-disulfide isomerase/thioredoxin
MAKKRHTQHALLVAPAFMMIAIISLCWLGLSKDTIEKQKTVSVFYADKVVIEGLDGQPLVWQQSTKPCTIVHVWASWCPACQQDHAKLLALQTQTACQIIGVINKDSTETALGYLGANRNPYDALGEASPHSVIALGVSTMPLTLLLDEQGNLIKRQEGQIDSSFLEVHYRHMEKLTR